MYERKGPYGLSTVKIVEGNKAPETIFGRWDATVSKSRASPSEIIIVNENMSLWNRRVGRDGRGIEMKLPDEQKALMEADGK